MDIARHVPCESSNGVGFISQFLICNESIAVWRADGMFESVFEFDIRFPVSRLNRDFGVILLVYLVTKWKITIGSAVNG
jgi:hypothetical protein